MKFQTVFDDKIPTVEITGVKPDGKDYMFDLMTVAFDKTVSDELSEKLQTAFRLTIRTLRLSGLFPRTVTGWRSSGWERFLSFGV